MYSDTSFHSLSKERYKGIQRCTYLSIVFNILITALQLIVAPLSHSQSLLAHGIHSASDFLSDILVLFATRQSSRPADKDHPYGHARLETLAVLLLGTALLAIGLGFCANVIQNLYRQEPVTPVTWLASAVALITFLSKEWIYHYLARQGEILKSPAVTANAWHSRIDGFSALIVLSGTIGSLLGWSWMDQVATVIMGLIIVRTGWNMAFQSFAELVDTGATEESLQGLRNTLLATPGVLSLHDVRTRKMASKILLEAHLQVPLHMSVSEAHLIGEHAKARTLQNHADVVDVLIHVHAEPDEESRLPDEALRATIHRHITQFHNQHDLPQPRITLHCFHGRIEVELLYPSGTQAATASGQEFLKNLRMNLQKEYPDVVSLTSYVAVDVAP